MSSASFGTVNATGLNVTGVLQASQVVTTKPIQVSNIVSTGTVTANNISVSGEIKGDLHVQGNVIAGGYVYGPNSIDTQNLTDRIALDPSQVYGYTSTSTPNIDTQYFIKPIVATTAIKLRDENGPTSVLASDIEHS